MEIPNEMFDLPILYHVARERFDEQAERHRAVLEPIEDGFSSKVRRKHEGFLDDAFLLVARPVIGELGSAFVEGEGGFEVPGKRVPTAAQPFGMETRPTFRFELGGHTFVLVEPVLGFVPVAGFFPRSALQVLVERQNGQREFGISSAGFDHGRRKDSPNVDVRHAEQQVPAYETAERERGFFLQVCEGAGDGQPNAEVLNFFGPDAARLGQRVPEPDDALAVGQVRTVRPFPYHFELGAIRSGRFGKRHPGQRPIFTLVEPFEDDRDRTQVGIEEFHQVRSAEPLLYSEDQAEGVRGEIVLHEKRQRLFSVQAVQGHGRYEIHVARVDVRDRLGECGHPI